MSDASEIIKPFDEKTLDKLGDQIVDLVFEHVYDQVDNGGDCDDEALYELISEHVGADVEQSLRTLSFTVPRKEIPS